MDVFDTIKTKLVTGNDVLIQVCGDSTGQGLRTVALQDANKGWVGRLGINIGVAYDVNVEYEGAHYPGSTTWPGFTQNITLHVSSRGDDAPTVTVRNGSIGGAQATHLISWITGAANIIPDTNPDIVFTACGFNDRNAGANISSRIQSLVSTIRARCPAAPIVVTTQNRSTGTYPTGHYLAHFSQMSTYFVGQSLNLDPGLIESEIVENVWVMDTQQAYTMTPLTDWMQIDDSVGGLHPNDLGYQAQADWMYSYFPAASVPFEPAIIAKINYRLNGYYHRVQPRVKVGGSFRSVIVRK